MKELRVENVSRLLNIMANGVASDQFARELTMNSIEAINRAKTNLAIKKRYSLQFKKEKDITEIHVTKGKP